jgi:hypothetical protein
MLAGIAGNHPANRVLGVAAVCGHFPQLERLRYARKTRNGMPICAVERPQRVYRDRSIFAPPLPGAPERFWSYW